MACPGLPTPTKMEAWVKQLAGAAAEEAEEEQNRLAKALASWATQLPQEPEQEQEQEQEAEF